MKFIIGLFIFAVALLFSFMFVALAVACANSWIMQDTFANGWDAAWDRWPVTIGFGLLFMGGGGAASRY